MNDRLPATSARGGMIVPLLALAIAFLIGVLVTGFAVRRWDRLAAWLHPLPVVQPVRIAVRVPIPVPVPAPESQVALASRVADIQARIDAIDARAVAASGDADRAEALLVAFAARRALDRGQPLGFLEGLLRDRFGASEAPAVAMVIASAQRPVTLPQLQDALAALGPTLATAMPNEGWWAATRREFGNLFVVHRADAASALPVDRLTRAQHALEQGQVDAASVEVSRMPGSARATDWLAAARRYSLARAALDRLETAALLRPRATAALPPAVRHAD